jgi:hypothetical protein
MRSTELLALDRLRAAVILALAAAIVGIAWISVSGVSGFLSVSTTYGSSAINLQFNPPWYWTVYLVAIAAVGIAQIVLFRLSFRSYSFVDPSFSTPATLALVAVIGFLLLFLGVGLFFAALVQAIDCAGGGNLVPTSCLLSGAFWSGIALLAIGAIITIIGYIGVLIGIWRVGTRTGNSLFKVAAVLMIFPYLNIIGAILILIGTQEAIGRLRSTAPATSFV